MAKLKRSKAAADMTSVDNACKTVLANIRFMGVDDPVQTVVITSSVPNEGKSFISQKLAEAMATSGKRTLLMECDLRRRTLSSQMGIHARHGLYAVVMGRDSLADSVARTRIPTLFFLDAEPGIPNPSDLFSSKRFARFLEELKGEFDYIVLDTPPVSAFVDSAVLSHLADVTLLVVRENFTKREEVTAAYEQLKKADGNVSGVIMNYCHSGGSEYYSYYYSKDGSDSKTPSRRDLNHNLDQRDQRERGGRSERPSARSRQGREGAHTPQH